MGKTQQLWSILHPLQDHQRTDDPSILWTGPVRHRAAAEDEARRKAQKEHQERLAAERKRMQRLETPSLALDSLVQAAINMELTNAGYYLRRREWRKKTT